MLLILVALLFSGLVQAVISPPLNWVVLHPFAWVPALLVFASLRGRRGLAAGWLVGIAANLAIFSWLPGTMMRFGGLPLPAAGAVWLLFAAAMGFYTALFALGLPRIRAVAGRHWPIAAAAWFCALEFLNPQIFGYLQGHAWYQLPQVFLWCAATGVSGVSFLVMLCNGVLAQALAIGIGRDTASWRDWSRNAGVLAACCVMAGVYSAARLGSITAAEKAAEPIVAAVIQPLHTIERRRELDGMKSDVYAHDLIELSQEAAQQAGNRKIDVFVWPEGALRMDPARSANKAVLDFVVSTGAEVWTGANHQEATASSRVAHNSAFRIFGQGSIDRRYDKILLVPFGEYVPLRDVIPGFDRIRTVGNFEPGTTVPIFDSGTTRFIFLICYEAIFPGFVRRAIAEQANLIVNVTVDAWYGNSSEQSQHLMLAAAQSALNGVPLLRATTTGISAVVDARGLMVAQAGNFTREALVVDVRPVHVASLYSKWGDWFAWLCVLVSAALLLRPARDDTAGAWETEHAAG